MGLQDRPRATDHSILHEDSDFDTNTIHGKITHCSAFLVC